MDQVQARVICRFKNDFYHAVVPFSDRAEALAYLRGRAADARAYGARLVHVDEDAGILVHEFSDNDTTIVIIEERVA